MSQGQRRLDQLPSLIKLAWPILISQLAVSGMGVVDTIMSGQVSPLDLAAVAIAYGIWLPALMFLVGLFSATTSLVAHAWGEKNIDKARLIIWQSIWLALLLGLGLAIFISNSAWILHYLSIDPAIHPITNRYLDGLALGIPAAAVYQVLRSASEGIGLSKPAMQINLLIFACNIPINYIFIYGHFGLPAMGGAGCGWATALLMTMSCIFLALYMAKAWVFDRLALFKASYSIKKFKLQKQQQILALGFPIGISVFAEVLIFSIIALLIGRLGADIVASHQIAMNISALTFMLPLSLSIATSIQVGQQLGAKQNKLASRSWKQALLLALLIALANATVLILLAYPITGLYAEDKAVRDLAASLMLFAAAYQISDAFQVTAAGALRGFRDTKVTMYITLCAYWLVGLPLGYSLGLTDLLGPASGPKGFWQSLLISLSIAAIFLLLRLIKIDQRHRHSLSTNNR